MRALALGQNQLPSTVHDAAQQFGLKAPSPVTTGYAHWYNDESNFTLLPIAFAIGGVLLTIFAVKAITR